MNQALQVEYTRNCILHRELSSDFKMSIQSVIEEKIGVRFKPHHLLINNESNLHGGPSTESHFKLTVVSDSFLGLSRVNRHRQIYDLLSEELENGVHALVLHLFTTDEWSRRETSVPQSPNCLGGSAAE